MGDNVKVDLEALKQELYKEMYDQIKAEVVEELSKQKQLEKELAEKRRKEERQKHEEYIMKMHESPDPWVEIVGWHENDDGTARIELEWNEAFIKMLRENGYTGISDEELVQKWIINVLYEVVEEEQEEASSNPKKGRKKKSSQYE